MVLIVLLNKLYLIIFLWRSYILFYIFCWTIICLIARTVIKVFMGTFKGIEVCLKQNISFFMDSWCSADIMQNFDI